MANTPLPAKSPITSTTSGLSEARHSSNSGMLNQVLNGFVA
jgi:hypothetical protein